MKLALRLFTLLALAGAAVPSNAQVPVPDAIPLVDRVARCQELLGNAKAAMERNDLRECSRLARLALDELEGITPDQADEGVRWCFETAAYHSWASGRFEDALEAYEWVLAYFEPRVPDEDAHLLAVRLNAAVNAEELGRLLRAKELKAGVLAVRERTLAEGDPDLQHTRLGYATTIKSLGDLAGARDLERKALEACERWLPPEHPHVWRARGNLAITFKRMGDLASARALQERTVEAYERLLPGNHPTVLRARTNLASTLLESGDLTTAHAMYEEIVGDYREVLPENHPDATSALTGLANTKQGLGDLAGARLLQERALETYMRALPHDHPTILRAKTNLANTLRIMGDLEGTLHLERGLLEAYERRLPKGHVNILHARVNLGVTSMRLDDAFAARAMFESAIAGFEEGAYPSNFPGFVTARASLADSLMRLGKYREARSLRESVLAAQRQRLPDDHPLVLTSRASLAMAVAATGDTQAARDRLVGIAADAERALPEDHPVLTGVLAVLADTHLALGDLEIAHELEKRVLETYSRTHAEDDEDRLNAIEDVALGALALGDVDTALAGIEPLTSSTMKRLAGSFVLAPRRARELARTQDHRVEVVLLFSGLPEATPNVRSTAFELVETVRHVSTAGIGGHVRDDEVLLLMQREAAALRTYLADRVTAGQGEWESPEAYAAELQELAIERDEAEARLREELVYRGAFTESIRLAALSEVLGEAQAAVGYLVYRRWFVEADSRKQRYEESVLAHVVRSDGSLARVELGPAERLRGLVDNWREALGEPLEPRGVTVRPAPSRDEIRAGVALREALLDPLLATAGESELTALHVCMDDFLHVVPLDALPLGGERVGDRLQVVNKASFARLLAPLPPIESEVSLVAVGGVSFGERAAAIPANARFVPLAGTQVEVEVLADRFRETFEVEAELLTGTAASKAALHASASGTRFLHIATHGWFRPESVASSAHEHTDGKIYFNSVDPRERVLGLAPLTVCGLALAGANRGRDGMGRVPGILTAEELAALELADCELAVLSACETNVGVSDAGTGIQSLQTALQVAGARTTITSLWRVGDERTRELMTAFYENLWSKGMGKADALWAAKASLRAKGHPVSAWAGWVLSGDPR